MKPRHSLLTLLAAAGSALPAAEPALLAPAKNWSAALFTRENFHSMTLRGSEARFADAESINVVDLNLTVFAGDATNHVETILLSSAATFLPKQNTAHGAKGVRLIRDDLEATGTRWTYDHAQKRVSLHDRVRIVFNAELQSILK
ncbi:MAG: hypothetical protein JWM88_1949 [Verrucomicrobia bacterium]|nr:hypothetical protein [Verrucomicrobiota bacterium]